MFATIGGTDAHSSTLVLLCAFVRACAYEAWVVLRKCIATVSFGVRGY